MENKEIRPKKMRKILFYIGFLVLLVACRKGLVYERFFQVDEKHWTVTDTVTFPFYVEEEVTQNVRIVLRNTGAYEKANLWLFLQLKSPDGNIQRDTLDCVLADDYGYWLGKGFSGKYETEHLLYEGKTFMEGAWELCVEQGMRQDTVEGISEVGLLIIKQGKK